MYIRPLGSFEDPACAVIGEKEVSPGIYAVLSPLKSILKCSVIIKISLFEYLFLMQSGQIDICTHVHMQTFPRIHTHTHAHSATSAKATAIIARCILGFTDPL